VIGAAGMSGSLEGNDEPGGNHQPGVQAGLDKVKDMLK
jgi:hypothetical protein